MQLIPVNRSRFLRLCLCIALSNALAGCVTQTIPPEALNATLVALQSASTRQAQELQATRFAQETALAAQVTSLAERAAARTPPASSAGLPAAPSAQAPTALPPTPGVESMIQTANILLFENMSGQRIYGVYHPQYVEEALNWAGYAFTDVGSAQGWFKDQLLSPTQWDLIIASSEANNALQGEYFDYLLTHLENGAAVIIEIWDLDQMAGGKITPLLEKCGVAFDKDWGRASEVAMWQLAPDHPIFNYPNSGISMQNTSPFWVDDHGDLMKLTSTGDAQLLLGTQPNNPGDHGTLVTCVQGRLLIQTFRSHDFARQSVVALWENTAHFTLKSKFESAP